ncbi:apotyrosinase chaperone MelC1 [Streptomyces clavuligerus]|nr:tyrosinase cofactor [Streptomyces clavuligerus]ANW22568.1 tyrosinase [Streptomyces clavuligerus]MBY6306855.1 tyrosinase cofactor [Streptomyces clavuligerus]QPL66932.1 tyrosinase cofactor [Streptomyces clavuligerus]QPL72962.1 tyrosinase cofactor [Streptomyces clavuligerus]QPL79035.1 tyrosinase cofactor [Streptomyces clavuligerus]
MSRLTRRQVIGVVTGAAAGSALAGLATATADSPPPAKATAAPAGTTGPDSFDEVFQGRRIQGLPAEGGAAHARGAHARGAHGHAGHGPAYRVLIDGRELHVMRHGKMGWSSAINHYERFATPLDAARTAVVSLKGAAVVPFDPTV